MWYYFDDSRCAFGIVKDYSSYFLLNCQLFVEKRTVLFNFLHHHIFRRDIITWLFGESLKDQAQNILLSKTVQTFIRNNRRFTVQRNIIPPPSILLMCYHKIRSVLFIVWFWPALSFSFFLYYKCLYLLSVILCQAYVYTMLGITLY